MGRPTVRSRPGGASLAITSVVALLVLSGLGLSIPRAHAPSPAAASVGPIAPEVRALGPIHPPDHRLAMLRAATVNPYAFYSSEPAPMGIADFGVNASGGGYTYQTSEFYGLTTIHHLSTYSSAAQSDQMTIQLNVVLTFLLGSTEYQYWVQDVAFVDTSTPTAPTVGFENNIWNFSSSSASLNSESVTGNGSLYQVSSGEYVYITGAATNGSGVTLTLPAQIGLLVQATTHNGDPEVVFQYRDGFGLVTYDNAIFPFAHGATDVNYTVDGTGYNQFGLFNDAELTMGGPGNGYGTAAKSAQVSMSLSYFNGRNFQSVANAFNFGSDTAEAIGDISGVLGTVRTNGSLFDNVTYSLSGGLAGLFNNSYDGSVTIVTQAASGTLQINGTTGLRYYAEPINVTLAPGNYSFALYLGTTLEGRSIDTLGPGEALVLFIDAGTVSTIDFTETGLTTGHAWSVSLGAATETSNSTSIRFLTINGTIGWRLTPIPGFVANVSHGQLTVAGTGAMVSIGFTEIFYAVTVFETGLPTGTNWSIGIANATHSSTGVGIDLTLPNGTFEFTVGIVPGYWIGAPSGGSLSVDGAKVLRTLNFRPFTYRVAVAESGLPTGTPWGVKFGGNWTNESIPVISVQAANGSYAVSVDAAAGYIANQTVGSVQVAGAPYFLNVTFRSYVYAVTFLEGGLANGTLWGVEVGNTYFSSTNATIPLELANGTYRFQIAPLLAYVNRTPLNGSFQVTGQPATVSVLFGVHPALLGYLLVTVTPGQAILLINGTESTSVSGSFDLPLLPGTYAIEFLATGYVPFYENVTIYPGSETQLPTVSLSVTPPTVPGTHKSTSPGTGGGFPGTDLWVGGILTAAAVAVLLAWALRRPPVRRSPGP